MPRTTARRYLKDRSWLSQIWRNDRGTFARLNQPEQRHLHDFYALATDLPDADAIERRQAVTLLQPSLPQRAGRALKALKREVVSVERYRRESIALGKKLDRKLPKPKRRRVSATHVVVRSVLQPVPDAARLARAVVEMAKAMAADERLRAAGSVPAPTACARSHRRGSGRVVRRPGYNPDEDQAF